MWRSLWMIVAVMTHQTTQGFPSRSCYKENISYNITHILYIDRRIHSALYWLTAFYQPQNLSGCSEWIIVDHPVFLICECAGSCSPRHFRTPPMVPSTLPRMALNSSHFIQNTDPFFQIHWYSAILDSGWFCKCLKTIWIYNWRNWLQLLVLLCTVPKSQSSYSSKNHLWNATTQPIFP